MIDEQGPFAEGRYDRALFSGHSAYRLSRDPDTEVSVSPTVIRMVPVAIALIDAGLRPPSDLFLGWFGPRGIASILFVLLILEESEVVHRNELFAVTVVTVALSMLLHGLSAAPLARRHALRVAGMGECEEIQAVSEIPLREGSPGAGVGTTS